MIPENIKQNKWFKISTNIYVLVSLFFIFWMLFFDTNSLRIFWSLNKKIDDLEGQKKELLRQINDDKLFIQKLSDSLELEKFGRENYFLKKEDEDIFIIEFSDSLKTSS
ncbi:MAG: septum formation initiator family protein [Flavobacteriaceae bacterium]|nr:septum formation initiator family protein [Flavobacteriaceae bacterium]MCH1385712.1 septum formation initiator family protein [Flavobacteriaceae bacterium]MDG0967804.1 septum formation initiator family protein [Flavobacteriaceae bacterium]